MKEQQVLRVMHWKDRIFGGGLVASNNYLAIHLIMFIQEFPLLVQPGGWQWNMPQLRLENTLDNKNFAFAFLEIYPPYLCLVFPLLVLSQEI